MPDEFEMFKGNSYNFDTVIFHARKRPNMRAEIAIRLVEHMAIVAAQEDGEDSAGRRALRLQSPDEVARRACEIANCLVNEFETRGWIDNVPSYEDIPPIKRAG